MNDHRSRDALDRPGDDVLGGMSARPRLANDEPEDAVERWARRTGRALAVLVSIGLIGWILIEAAAKP